jgi:hypothetical protein
MMMFMFRGSTEKYYLAKVYFEPLYLASSDIKRLGCDSQRAPDSSGAGTARRRSPPSSGVGSPKDDAPAQEKNRLRRMT